MTIEIGVVLTMLSLALGYLGYSLNKTKVVKADIQQSADIKAELGYISKGVNDIRYDLRTKETQMNLIGERVTRVEESAKQAHRRLDSLEKDVN